MKIRADELATSFVSLSLAIEKGDSMAGRITWDAGDEPFVYEVEATYRTGNLHGQGSIVVIPPTEKPAPVSLADRLAFFQQQTREFSPIIRKLMTTVSIEGFSPWLSQKLGEASGIFNTIDRLLSEELDAAREVKPMSPVFLAALDIACDRETTVQLLLKSDGEESRPVGKILEIEPSDLIFKTERGTLLIPLDDVRGIFAPPVVSEGT